MSRQRMIFTSNWKWEYYFSVSIKPLYLLAKLNNNYLHMFNLICWCFSDAGANLTYIEISAHLIELIRKYVCMSFDLPNSFLLKPDNSWWE